MVNKSKGQGRLTKASLKEAYTTRGGPYLEPKYQIYSNIYFYDYFLCGNITRFFF